MLNIHRRTWQQHRVGRVLITVQMEPAANDHGRDRQRNLAELNMRLVRLLSAHRLNVTWAVGDPAHSAATPLILRSGVDHEMAVLGDAHWIGPTAGRTRFARELSRRIAQARAAGLDVTSLLPRVAAIKCHVDLLVKHGITSVVDVAGPRAHGRRPVPKALHYGVWELPTSARMPLRMSWFGRGWRALARQVRRSAREATMFHLVIDAPELGPAGGRGEAAVGRLARRVAELRDRGLVRVETLSMAAARLAAVPSAAPQQSILRRAA